ncbi:DUF6503 family protein [Pontibacter rugosus]|uniref:DUF6503 family protein n=1 Tax=Pontibacter rugosus TaxID=1745966 RepID=A0ABW3SNF1_9BACT
MASHKLLKSLLCLFLLTLPLWTASAQQSDAKAIADKVMKNMGGQKNWNNTRYLAWTFNDQYQIWDKAQNRFRWEKDSLIAVIDTQTKDGKVYVAGQEIVEPAEKQKMLDRAYALWINNSYWLVMPFKLQDPGVALKHVGEGETIDGAKADILQMTFEEVGLTPQNKYHVWVDRDKGLVTQWAFFRKFDDAEPAFTRRWSNYQDYGKIKLASDRSNPQSDFELFHIAAPANVPDKVFNSPVPVEKL